jgi:hypothetical protein
MIAVKFALAMLLLSPTAFADGFVCENKREALSLEVYNNVDPVKGTRTAAAMILMDLSSPPGSREIARFSDKNKTLRLVNAIYLARVDHRYNDSNNKVAKVAGTTLGELMHFNLELDFSYARPVAPGQFVRGKLNLFKRSGEEIPLDMSCTRYLKG